MQSAFRLSGYYTGLLFFLFLSAGCQSPQGNAEPSASPSINSSPSKNNEPLVATIGNVYAKGSGKFDIDIQVKKGKLKLGDKVDIVNASGIRYAATVSAMRNPYEDVKEIEDNETTHYIVVMGPADARFDADFVLVNPGADAAAAPVASRAAFTGHINNQPWKGAEFPYSFSLFQKGVEKFAGNKPYLMLAFRSMDATDDRQLTIMVFTSTAQPGIYEKDKLEILLSGSPSGNITNPEMWGYAFPANKQVQLKVEIISFNKQDNNSGTISGKISGHLVKALCKDIIAIEGSFTNLKVTIYNEPYLGGKPGL